MSETSFTTCFPPPRNALQLQQQRMLQYAASLDQGGELAYFAARPTSPDRRRRPPLQHGIGFDQSDFEIMTFAQQEDTPETTPSGELSTEEQQFSIDLDTEVFVRETTPKEAANEDTNSFREASNEATDFYPESSNREAFASSKDANSAYRDAFYRDPKDPTYFFRDSNVREAPNSSMPEILESMNSFGENIELSYERSYKNRANEYFYDRPGPSSSTSSNYFKSEEVYDTCFSLNDPLQIQRMSVTALFEKFCADEREPRVRPVPIRQASETTFRTSRLKGISSDRIIGGGAKKRGDRVSTSSLGDQPASGSCFSIFEKRKGKLGKLEKSKRLSASALYDQSPTGNLAKVNRIRSTEIYKKFNSEEFNSRYEEKVLPSTSKSDNAVSKFKFYENPLDRASVAKLYEKFCYDDKIKSPASMPAKFPDKQISLESNETKSTKTEPYSAASLSERTSDIMSQTILAIRPDANIFNFDLESLQHSELQSDLLLTPERSASISNTVQLLFEDPRSNRTSISDLYEPCFSVSLAPKRPSLKRDFGRHWDLNTLDLRPIDDESPTTSKQTSSPDDGLQNFDSKSNNSDVFIISDNLSFIESDRNGKAQMLEDINEGDSDLSSDRTSLSESLIPKSMSSRPSMQKLQPYKPKIVLEEQLNHEVNNKELVDDLEKLTLKNCAVKSDKLSVIRVKKDKDSSVRKRTRCFPL